MTFQESARCPNCLELGKMRFEYSYYYCDKCEMRWEYPYLQHFINAFEKGRNFQKQQDYKDTYPEN